MLMPVQRDGMIFPLDLYLESLVLLLMFRIEGIGLVKFMARTDITKTPRYLLESKKQFLHQSNIVFSLVRLKMWLLRTNKSTILL